MANTNNSHFVFGVIKFDDLEVTSTVDAWIDGNQPNHGFGLWGVTVAGEQGDAFDFISSDNAAGGGPELVNVVPEPSGLTLLIGIAILSFAAFRKR